MAEFIWMRNPRFTWISPSSSVQGTRNMITRSGSTRRSMILACPVFGVALDDQGCGFHHLEDRLVELGLGRVLGLDQGDDVTSVIPHRSPPFARCFIGADTVARMVARGP